MMRRRWILSCLGTAAVLSAGVALPATSATAVTEQTGTAHADTAQASAARAGSAQAGVFLDTLQMTSASTGWALRWTSNPAAATGPAPFLVPARTSDGARRWKTVTPPGARALLSTPFASVVLQAVSGRRAELAVTAATSANQDGTAVHLTRVFMTSNGGRTWTRSAALKVPGFAEFVSFPDPAHGWLLEDFGNEAIAPGLDYVAVYRSTDHGRRWSKVAHTPPAPSTAVSTSGLTAVCDKAGLVFARPAAGWLTGGCNNLADALRVTRDGGSFWSAQALPVPADTCTTDGCLVSGPQFFGRTGFVSLLRAPAAPDFLVSHDLGRKWRTRALPAGGGLDPRITFFSARDGVLVSAGTQGSIGSVFFTTRNAGKTWTAVPQGTTFTQLGVGFDFVSTRTGFAWIPGTDSTGSAAPQMFRTDNSGRTWTPFSPVSAR